MRVINIYFRDMSYASESAIEKFLEKLIKCLKILFELGGSYLSEETLENLIREIGDSIRYDDFTTFTIDNISVDGEGLSDSLYRIEFDIFSVDDPPKLIEHITINIIPE